MHNVNLLVPALLGLLALTASLAGCGGSVTPSETQVSGAPPDAQAPTGTATSDSTSRSNVAPTGTAAATLDRTYAPSPTPQTDQDKGIALPDHLAFTWWEWDNNTVFREMTFEFTIHNDPGNFSDEHGLFLMVCFGSISGHNFYFGLQTNVFHPNPFKESGKGLIFSRWDERDLDLARTVDDSSGWYESSGHEGDFIGVRRAYDWESGGYQMRLAPDGLDEEGEWFGVWLSNLSTDEEVWVGSLKFPLQDGTTVVKESLYTTIEIYGSRSIRAADIPEWNVTVKAPQGDGIRALAAYTGYSIHPEAQFPNADIQCDPNAGACHFLVGGSTEQIGDEGHVRFD